MTTNSGRTLVYVHGKGCQPAPETLMDLSMEALAAGLERDHPASVDGFNALDKRLAFYGDVANGLLSGCGEQYDETLDIGDLRNALRELRAIDRRKKFSLGAYDRLPGKSALPELAADVAAPLLGSIGLSQVLIARVAPDLDAYWSEGGELAPAARAALRDVLLPALAAGERVLLVSHGSGSIVAWDVLWELSHDSRYADSADYKVDTWLTLGAPLGDSMVRRRIAGAGESGRQRYPANVVSWHNVSAEDDWMCHDNTLADDFRPMLQQRQVSSIRDYRIYNLAVRYGRSDPHCPLGYLVHPRVAHIVADWLDTPGPEPLPEISDTF